MTATANHALQANCSGEEDSWAFSLQSGQRVVVVLRVPYHGAVLYGDPPELPPILSALSLSSDDSRLYP